MARRALGPATLAVVAAIEAVWAGEQLAVACSGGSDSLALALAARVVARRRDVGLRALVVDHGLQEGSAARSRGVADLLESQGVPAVVLPVLVAPAGEGIEAAARTARYTALAGARADVERIHLGHTLDDQAETVLLGLARGSGLRSLAGMPATRDGFVRPLLGLRSSVTTQACRELGVTWWEDPHNAEDRFTRSRVRQRVLPVLEAELGPGVAEALARTAQLARDDADLLDALAADALAAATRGDALDCATLLAQPGALRRRVLRRWLLAAGAPEVTRAHVETVTALVADWHGQRWVEVPGLRVRREAGRLLTTTPGRTLAEQIE